MHRSLCIYTPASKQLPSKHICRLPSHVTFNPLSQKHILCCMFAQAIHSYFYDFLGIDWITNGRLNKIFVFQFSAGQFTDAENCSGERTLSKIDVRKTNCGHTFSFYLLEIMGQSTIRMKSDLAFFFRFKRGGQNVNCKRNEMR